MQKLLYPLLLLLCPLCLPAQVTNEYTSFIKQAETYYNNKQYKESVGAYSSAFKSGNKTVMISDIYSAACAMAHAGMADSAFATLDMLAGRPRFSEYNHLIGDPDLVSLHKDMRWVALCQKVKENKENLDKEQANLNKPLVAILDTVYTDDQAGGRAIDEATKKLGKESKEVRELAQSRKEKDSINLIKVEKILDKYGWLGPDVVGSQGSRTIFLVVQHAGLKAQEKYLPMMREAVKDKKASASNLALLEDRVLLRKGMKQVYGSQIGATKSGEYYIHPLDDPDNVDKRRAEVGLGPLADYVQRWQLKWDPEAYKKQLPEIEKMQKETFGN